MKKKWDTKTILALVTAVLPLSLSTAGFFYQNLYTERINQITRYELMGQDAVTAIISLVFLAIILFLDFKMIQVKIIWLGCLLYQFYIYAYYSFGGISSVFYILYLVITGLSLFLFINILSGLIAKKEYPAAGKKYPVQSLSVFLLCTVGLVTMIELQELIGKTIIHKNPLNPFTVFYVLDLCVIFPFIITASVYNLKKTGSGRLFCGISLIKIITILPAVILNDLFHWIYKGIFLDPVFDTIAAVITAAGIFFFVTYLKNIHNPDYKGTEPAESR